MQNDWYKFISRWVWRKRHMRLKINKWYYYIRNVCFLSTIFFFFAGHWALKGKDFWTSGTDQGCKGKMHWCSKNRGANNQNLSWSNTVDGDCISIKFSNQSQYSKIACSKKLNYICEVYFFHTKVWFCWFDKAYRSIRPAPMGKQSKTSAWKCGTFQLVCHNSTIEMHLQNCIVWQLTCWLSTPLTMHPPFPAT